jgi:hypothetical protein
MSGTDHDSPSKAPLVAKRLSPAQLVVWNVAGAIEIVTICSIISDMGDMSDPVVLAIAVASSLLAVWFTRKWILSQLTDEKLERLRKRRR